MCDSDRKKGRGNDSHKTSPYNNHSQTVSRSSRRNGSERNIRKHSTRNGVRGRHDAHPNTRRDVFIFG